MVFWFILEPLPLKVVSVLPSKALRVLPDVSAIWWCHFLHRQLRVLPLMPPCLVLMRQEWEEGEALGLKKQCVHFNVHKCLIYYRRKISYCCTSLIAGGWKDDDWPIHVPQRKVIVCTNIYYVVLICIVTTHKSIQSWLFPIITLISNSWTSVQVHIVNNYCCPPTSEIINELQYEMFVTWVCSLEMDTWK